MKVSRSGYYKWIKTKNILNNYELNRKDLGELILEFENKVYKYNLVLNDEVKKASYFKILFNNLKDIVTGSIRKNN